MTCSTSLVLLYHLTLLPAAAVIGTLQFYTYYRTGKFTLLSPFSFLTDNDRKRTLIILTFGAMADTFIDVLIDKDNVKIWEGHWVFDPIKNLLAVVELGVIFYPIFICLHSRYVVLAAIIGVFYTLFITIASGVKKFVCAESFSDTVTFFFILPKLLCLLGIMAKFLQQVTVKIKKRTFEEKDENKHVLKQYQYKYVRKLLNHSQFETPSPNLFQKYVWRNDAEFKYSTLVLASLTIVLIAMYKLTVVMFYYIHLYKDSIVEVREYLLVPLVLSLLFSLLTYIIQIFFFLKTHRKDMKDVYKKGVTTGINFSESITLRHYLYFPGLLTSFMIFGLLIQAFVLTLVMFSIVYVLKRLDRYALILLKNSYGWLVIPILVYISVRLLIAKVFKSKTIDSSHGFILNIKFYHIVLYFTMFYNLLLSWLFCLSTVLLSAVVNVVCLGRIDRLMMNPKYFQFFYRGNLAYLSFLKVEGMQKNPVMRCFCEILLTDATMHKTSSQSWNHGRIVPSAPPRYSKMAFNRWHLAYQIIKNPSLAEYRKKVHIAQVINISKYI